MSRELFMRIRSYAILLLCVLPSLGSAQLTLAVPDDGWRLWLDRAAAWEKDSIYLPADANLQKLPVNPPTGGWDVLSTADSKNVKLPATVEQYFWGVNGFRPYDGEYAYEAQDSVVKNGSYLGVSWWWREVNVPASFTGKQVKLTVRGARLRAEVFVNRQLVGYNIITETAFTCDVTRAIHPGKKNQIAIRVTNPGGRLDWVDTELMSWGKTSQRFHKSHGFGGLDRGITLRASDPVAIRDAWVRNTAEPGTIEARATLRNSGLMAVDAVVRFEVMNKGKGETLTAAEQTVQLPPGGEGEVHSALHAAAARLWSPSHPILYLLKVSMRTTGRSVSRDDREVTFGFRWFEPVGIGTNAVLRLNRERIRLTSAISWGFWGVNGLWPTPDLAEREVRAAKTLGMNCIQFHRNVGKTEVLDAQDRIGLLRYMEPGGGQTAFGEKFLLYSPSPTDRIDDSGTQGDAQTFAEQYMEEKIIRMVRDHRSHPSLIMYSIQNEIHPDLHNPRVFRILRRIHEEDPSRIVVVKSGFPSGNPSTNQAWMEPYGTIVHYDSGAAYTGWWDDHTVGGPGVWQDDMYRSPGEFTHRSTNDREIVMWGEMLGAAAPDNHAEMVKELRARGGSSYDLAEHEEILKGYDAFLDRWKFRGAFPTAGALFRSLGNKSYDFWGRVVETARLAEANDYFVMSGWESTAIENHSGIVDNLRNFKGNPALISTRLAPLRPVIRASSLVYLVGAHPHLDLFVLNETQAPHGAELRLTLQAPGGTPQLIGTYPVPARERDRFVYPVAQHVFLPPPLQAGTYFVRAELGSVAAVESLLVIHETGTGPLPRRVGLISALPALQTSGLLFPDVAVEPFQADRPYDAVIAANRFTRPAVTGVDSTMAITGTKDPELYRHIFYGDPNSLEFLFPGLPRDSATVTLKFAELFQNAEGLRVFDVAINGDTVLRDFDVFKAAGGKCIAYDRTFHVLLDGGVLHLTFPRVPRPSARICAIRIASRGKIISVWSGTGVYRDSEGQEWQPYGPPAQLSPELLKRVRAGLPLLVLAEGEAAAEFYAKELAAAGAFTYKGSVGEARASWMGSWYFVRSHPLYDGLPVNCEMGSYYQVPVENSAGVVVEGNNVEVAAGYARDHERQVGAGSFTATLGSGIIAFHSVSGVVSGLLGKSTGMHPVIVRRLIANSLRYITR